MRDSPRMSRRDFLIRGAVAVLGTAGAVRLASGPVRSFIRAGTGKSLDGFVLPPGAQNAARFSEKCTSCRLCALNCPAGIIKAAYPFGPVRLDYRRSGCRYDCARCASVCPSGALRVITPEDKQWLKIGEPLFDALKCRVVTDGVACDLCAKACPKEAIFMTDTPSGMKIPEIALFHCIGCGACQAACPASVSAIHVRGVEQRMTDFEF